jgi:serine protease Do
VRSVYIAALVALCFSCGGRQSPGRVRNQATVAVAIFCNGNDIGSGSGVVVSPHHVLTAAHVTLVCKDSQFEIEIADGTRFAATVDKSWPEIDIARLKVEETLKQTPITRIGGALEEEDVICFHSGSPSRDIRCGQVENVEPFGLGNVRHSAIVEPGNSGSPVFDRQGRLVGIITHYRKCNNGQICGGRFSSIWNRKFVMK